jgi:hypothetical protein
MNAEEFRELLAAQTDAQLLVPCLHDENTPYVFETHPPSWDGFRATISGALGVHIADIRVVGSGRLGFSLKPGHNLRRFRDTSDVDVAVVNPDLFDRLWLLLLSAVYPRPPESDQFGGWLQERRNEVYTGWIAPRGIRLNKTIFGSRASNVLEFKTRWFNALKEVTCSPTCPRS